MSLPREYQELAKMFGVTRKAGQTDEEFMRWLDNLRGHTGLLRKATEWQVPITNGMTSADLREAIQQQLLELLKERGFAPKVKVKLPNTNNPERIVEIREIDVKSGKNPGITVKFWTISPWTKADNRGRANHEPAEVVLKTGTVLS
ncbi:MAG TPA: hypothetical protein VD907_06390 [Verrucomicrobiae bacterium]|nr:hypothetical protein [Verrucomicrobiae bacterium]